jgi:membrane-associated protein
MRGIGYTWRVGKCQFDRFRLFAPRKPATVGNYFGAKAMQSRLVKKEYIAKTQEFYDQYGGKTVVLARFIPIVRTFAPFVAGVGSMSYAKFGLYNIVGAILWTVICTGAGFGFGNVPAVHDNFSLVVLGIVVVSVLPIVFELLAAKRKGGNGGRNGAPGSVKLEGGRLGIDFRGSA